MTLNISLLKKKYKFAHLKIIKGLNQKEYFLLTPFSNHEKASKQKGSEQ